jgi:hypothetical protein
MYTEKDRRINVNDQDGKRKGKACLTDELLVTQDLAHRKRRLWRYRHPVEHDPPTGTQHATDLLRDRASRRIENRIEK